MNLGYLPSSIYDSKIKMGGLCDERFVPVLSGWFADGCDGALLQYPVDDSGDEKDRIVCSVFLSKYASKPNDNLPFQNLVSIPKLNL